MKANELDEEYQYRLYGDHPEEYDSSTNPAKPIQSKDVNTVLMHEKTGNTEWAMLLKGHIWHGRLIYAMGFCTETHVSAIDSTCRGGTFEFDCCFAAFEVKKSS